MMRQMAFQDYAPIPTLEQLHKSGLRGKDIANITYRSRHGVRPCCTMRKTIGTNASGLPVATTRTTRVDLS